MSGVVNQSTAGAKTLRQDGLGGVGCGCAPADCQIGLHFCFEIVDRFEFDLVAEVIDEVEVEGLAVEVTVESEEVGFDLAFGIAEGGEGSDADGGGVGGLAHAASAGVDAIGGDELGDLFKIGGRDTELPAALETLDDQAGE